MPGPRVPDDDDGPVVVHTTLGPFRLERRAGGRSAGEADHRDAPTSHSTTTEDHS